MSEKNAANEARLILLHALTPVHVGTGQAVANVDLPIAREKATGYPIIPASAFKGVLRDYFKFVKQQPDSWLIRAFGSEPPRSEQASSTETAPQLESGDWAFTDLRILCLPVRSFYGTFAYVTCPLVLKRLLQVAKALGVKAPFSETVPDVKDTKIVLANQDTLGREGKVYLEELDLEVGENGDVGKIAKDLARCLFGSSTDEQGESSEPNSQSKLAEQEMFTQRFAIVSNQIFDYLSETATEIAARVRLDDNVKTVISGALWYEEAVPAESIFYGFVTHVKPAGHQVPLNQLDSQMLVQIGGDATIGRGICKVVIVHE
ncbi:MAG: type III-B CRISPR module RAMP protein Cmr4 [Armatimonadota bacterium]|nr:type III-B CRISPR module RAMP protein Cmr4 [Armatimonadota bacterium]